jgi:hypothetical protein
LEPPAAAAYAQAFQWRWAPSISAKVLPDRLWREWR